MVLKSKTRMQGGSVITSLPAEVARRLAVGAGQELYWQETSPGVYTVTAIDADQARALEAHERVIEKYKDVFAALAK
jgi:hypothetical protein